VKKNTKRLIVICFLSVAALVGWCVWKEWRRYDWDRDLYFLRDWDLGGGRKIILYELALPERANSAFYEVRVGDRTVVGPCHIGCPWGKGDIKCDLMLGKSGYVAAVVWHKDPNIVLAIHDFGDGRSWPGQCIGSAETVDRDKMLAEDLLEKLKTETEGRDYTTRWW
jgi:hypothetical protein